MNNTNVASESVHLKRCSEGCHLAVSVPVRKEETSNISHFRFCLQNLEKEEEINCQVSRRKEIRMKRAKINTIEDGPTVEEKKIESGFNKKFSNTEKSPARLIKMKEKKEEKKRADERPLW